MIAVIFEVEPHPEHRQQYLDIAARAEWRNLQSHRGAQAKGRATVFKNYRLRVAGVIRDYGMSDRDQVPLDSRETHDR